MLQIEQTEVELRVFRRIISNAEEQTSNQVFKLDGGESINPVGMGRGEYKSKASWDKNKLVILGTQSMAGPNGTIDIVMKTLNRPEFAPGLQSRQRRNGTNAGIPRARRTSACSSYRVSSS